MVLSRVAVHIHGDALSQLGQQPFSCRCVGHLHLRKRQYEHITQQAPVNPPLQPGDIAGMISRIQGDFQQAYFVTGRTPINNLVSMLAQGVQGSATSYSMRSAS